MKRFEVIISGQVQGVGFRPHVYKKAKDYSITGWVRNNGSGVLLQAQGDLIAEFLLSVQQEAPFLAKIKKVSQKEIDCLTIENDFLVLASENEVNESEISPDTAICKDCLAELFAKDSRFYLYPFINCTQCGPRPTISISMPYDRHNTVMREFKMCGHCCNDYHEPSNRRYHAQPIACSQCGPQLSSSFPTIISALTAGKIVALKTVGGYQLLCDAKNESAVFRLRQLKKREAKPFALMTLNTASIKQYCHCSEEEQALLAEASRPVVLLARKSTYPFYGVAEGLSKLGFMLPPNPVYYLLFYEGLGQPEGSEWLLESQPLVLIATSANQSGEALIIDDEEANTKLASIADLIVSHNRKIVARVDDSVCIRTSQNRLFIRRARGFIPESIALPHSIPNTLALGADLKNTFCFTRDDEAFVSQHIGSLTSRSTIDSLHEAIEQWRKYLNIKIDRVACDWHPDFYSTRISSSFNRPIIQVQHHHAHLLTTAAENQLSGPLLGLALDGFGLGEQGQSWGGELMLLNEFNFHRLSHFHPLYLPGGEVAVSQPWRMGAALLAAMGKLSTIETRFASQQQASLTRQMLENPANLWQTTACGRLFDGVSALLGICELAHYEGQAAMLLESCVTDIKILPDGWNFQGNQFNLLPLCQQIVDMDRVEGANYFHGTLIAGLTEWLLLYAKELKINKLVLGGGCFVNNILRENLIAALHEKGIESYLPRQLPINDGGISLGQAWIAGNYGEGLCV